MLNYGGEERQECSAEVLLQCSSEHCRWQHCKGTKVVYRFILGNNIPMGIWGGDTTPMPCVLPPPY